MPIPDHITADDLADMNAETEADMLIALWHALDLESMVHGAMRRILSEVRANCISYLRQRPFVPSIHFACSLSKVENYFTEGLRNGHVAPHQRRLFLQTYHLTRQTCLVTASTAQRHRLETTLHLYRSVTGLKELALP